MRILNKIYNLYLKFVNPRNRKINQKLKFYLLQLKSSGDRLDFFELFYLALIFIGPEVMLINILINIQVILLNNLFLKQNQKIKQQ